MENNKRLLLMQITAFLISSIAIGFMPLGSYYDGKPQRIIAIVFGIVFWLFLLIGIALSIVIRNLNKAKKVTGKLGVIRFFKNKYAKMADVILIISFVLSVIIIALESSVYFGAVVFCFFAFSFEMHCILNGKYFNALFINKSNK